MVPAAKKEKPGGKIGSGNSGALLWSGESGSFPSCPGGGCTQEDQSSVKDKGPKGPVILMACLCVMPVRSVIQRQMRHSPSSPGAQWRH